MEYYASMGQGEVCVKGTNVFLGYYKEYDTTLQTVDEMGWHHTGDIGQWMQVTRSLRDGYIYETNQPNSYLVNRDVLKIVSY